MIESLTPVTYNLIAKKKLGRSRLTVCRLKKSRENIPLKNCEQLLLL
jgi:hypothetical protein